MEKDKNKTSINPKSIKIRSDLYSDFPSKRFVDAIKKSSQALNDLSSGKEYSEGYLIIKSHLNSYLEDRNNLVPLMKFESLRDLQRVITTFKQERNSSSQEDNDILEKIILNENKSIEIINRIEESITESNNDLVTQKLLEVYYSRYNLFETYKDSSFIRKFKVLLNKGLLVYEGKNKRVLKAKKTPSITKNKLMELLTSYPKAMNLEDIQYDLRMQTDHEIWHKILILQLIETVKSWSANQSDSEVEATLQEVDTHKKTTVDNNRNLIEEVASIMLTKCMKVNAIDDFWLNWVFENIGDPRNHYREQVWLRIGQEIFIWLRAKLSQGDVREFLENMTDGHGDDIYQYRRQFWMQYIEYVQYAKVMLNPAEIHKLVHKNRDLFNRFKSSPETYSRLNDSTGRSCIYIDFGEFKVIEGTHNAMLRFYENVPINLRHREYDYSQFHNTTAKRLLTHEFTHSSSTTYSWQNKVRRLLNKRLGSNIILKDVVLSKDASGEKWQEITNRFFAKAESIS